MVKKIEVPAEHWSAAEEAVEKYLNRADPEAKCEVYWEGFSQLVYSASNPPEKKEAGWKS